MKIGCLILVLLVARVASAAQLGFTTGIAVTSGNDWYVPESFDYLWGSSDLIVGGEITGVLSPTQQQLKIALDRFPATSAGQLHLVTFTVGRIYKGKPEASTLTTMVADSSRAVSLHNSMIFFLSNATRLGVDRGPGQELPLWIGASRFFAGPDFRSAVLSPGRKGGLYAMTLSRYDVLADDTYSPSHLTLAKMLLETNLAIPETSPMGVTWMLKLHASAATSRIGGTRIELTIPLDDDAHRQADSWVNSGDADERLNAARTLSFFHDERALADLRKLVQYPGTPTGSLNLAVRSTQFAITPTSGKWDATINPIRLAAYMGLSKANAAPAWVDIITPTYPATTLNLIHILFFMTGLVAIPFLLLVIGWRNRGKRSRLPVIGLSGVSMLILILSLPMILRSRWNIDELVFTIGSQRVEMASMSGGLRLMSIESIVPTAPAFTTVVADAKTIMDWDPAFCSPGITSAAVMNGWPPNAVLLSIPAVNLGSTPVPSAGRGEDSFARTAMAQRQRALLAAAQAAPASPPIIVPRIPINAPVTTTAVPAAQSKGFWQRCGFNAARGALPVTPILAGPYRYVTIPWWAIASFAALLPAWRIRQWRKHARDQMEGCCPNCGYDLRASPERCPECGRRAPPGISRPAIE